MFNPGDLFTFNEKRLTFIYEQIDDVRSTNAKGKVWFNSKGVYFVISNVRNYLYIIDEYKKAGWTDASVIRRSKRLE